MPSVESLLAWGPVCFGAIIFAPMWAAVLTAADVSVIAGTPNIALTLPIGLAWGLVAKHRGRWL